MYLPVYDEVYSPRQAVQTNKKATQDNVTIDKSVSPDTRQ